MDSTPLSKLKSQCPYCSWTPPINCCSYKNWLRPCFPFIPGSNLLSFETRRHPDAALLPRSSFIFLFPSSGSLPFPLFSVLRLFPPSSPSIRLSLPSVVPPRVIPSLSQQTKGANDMLTPSPMIEFIRRAQ